MFPASSGSLVTQIYDEVEAESRSVQPKRGKGGSSGEAGEVAGHGGRSEEAGKGGNRCSSGETAEGAAVGISGKQALEGTF
jgi:hypothetical protein